MTRRQAFWRELGVYLALVLLVVLSGALLFWLAGPKVPCEEDHSWRCDDCRLTPHEAMVVPGVSGR